MIDIRRAESIDGFMKPEELHWLAGQASRCQVVVEVGSFKGRSTRALADHCPGVVYAVDPWGGTYFNDSGKPHGGITDTAQRGTFEANMAPHVETGRVVPVQSTLAEALARDLATVKADLVFIDGDHREASVRSDINNALTILRPGGIISGHDFGRRPWPGVERAVLERFAFQSVNRCRSIWWVRV
jgi:predicted O-methyltransferase YrrM